MTFCKHYLLYLWKKHAWGNTTLQGYPITLICGMLCFPIIQTTGIRKTSSFTDHKSIAKVVSSDQNPNIRRILYQTFPVNSQVLPVSGQMQLYCWPLSGNRAYHDSLHIPRGSYKIDQQSVGVHSRHRTHSVEPSKALRKYHLLRSHYGLCVKLR